MNTLHSKIWYAKKWSIDILIDILGGISLLLEPIISLPLLNFLWLASMGLP